jgi:predicted dehydrogenase
MATLRLGIIGLGNMGRTHARNVLEGRIPRVKLTAVADTDPERRAQFPGVAGFADADSLIRSGLVEAVLIATPHYHHTPSGVAALRAGLHVLMEKPISVHVADAETLLAAHRNPRQVFAAMLNQRTDPFYRKLRDLITTGRLGEIRRVNWIVTNWFRSNAYYASSGWRATWKGEGGGVLLNQCPHNLDLFQWLFGMPTRVRGFCQFGRYHPIEVEDDVTAYLELPGGANAVFITSTGEAPGTNRLEVTAERGKVVLEDDQLTFTENRLPMSEFSRTTPASFAMPPHRVRRIAIKDHGGQHVAIIANFVKAILDGTPLIAPAADGLKSVELANAILLSSWTDRTVDLPINRRTYARWLQRQIARSASSHPAAPRQKGR